MKSECSVAQPATAKGSPFRHSLLQMISGAAMVGLLTGCLAGPDEAGASSANSSGSSTSPVSPATYRSIGGVVSGLRSNTTLVLQGSNAATLTVASNGAFAFPNKVAAGTSYSVTVGQQPLRQKCTVTNGTGIAAGDVSNVAITCVPKFTVFEFLKLKTYADSTGSHTMTSGYIPEAWFQSFGVRPINLIYGSRLLDCPPSSPSDQCTVDAQKMATSASGADSTGVIPVSLDLEVWDAYRFRPNSATGNGQSILQNLAFAIQTFKNTNPNALVGLYGEAPQNTFGWRANTCATYGPLDQKYAPVAALVDFYSPVLYNYGYDGTANGDSNWQSALTFDVQQAQAYDSGSSKKDMFPYITPGWKDSSGRSQLLTYDQMMFRLNALKASGATGCIVWISSSAVDASGKPVAVDATSGWFKAIVDFVAANQ